VCAVSISPDTVFRAVQVGYQRWKGVMAIAR
jgi:hypothetical protein